MLFTTSLAKRCIVSPYSFCVMIDGNRTQKRYALFRFWLKCISQTQSVLFISRKTNFNFDLFSVNWIILIFWNNSSHSLSCRFLTMTAPAVILALTRGVIYSRIWLFLTVSWFFSPRKLVNPTSSENFKIKTISKNVF